MKNNTLNLFIKLMTWLNVYWFPNVPEVDMHTKQYVDHIISLITNTGIINTIKRIKLYRLCVTKYLCGQPLDKVPMVIGLTRSGFPKQIKGMKALIDSGKTSSIRFVLTLLGLSRALKAEGTVSYASITDPQVINESTLKAIEDFIPIFIQDNNLDIYEGSWNKMDSNLSTKAGPHGLATWTSWKSVFYLPEHLILSIKEFGGQELYEFITSIRSNFDIRIMEKFFNLKDTIKVGSKDPNAKKVKTFKAFKSTTDIRKLSIVHDPELKERVIAILDWFSQESLRPFHNYCFSLLRSMKQDRTFTQDPIITDKLEKHSYHSLDLSAATDRFPIRLQKSLVEHLTGSAAKAQAWETILTSIPYRTPEGDYIKYNVGQPMGAYSSWAVFTLSSLMKSHTSPNCYEFAKRWFRNGIEVSGIPVRGFLDNINKYHILYMNVISLIDRNLHTARYTTIPDLVMSLLRVTTNLKDRQYANLYSRLTSLHAMHLYLHTDNKLQLRNLLDGKVQGFSLPHQEDELFGFLEMVVRKSADSMLADNARRLGTYCNDLIGAIYAKTDQMVEQTNGWRPSIKDFGLIPIVPAIFSEMKITVQGLVMPSHTKSIKDLIKILDFEDPERASTIRTSFRLIGTESKLFKQCLITLRSMSKGETIPFSMNPRAAIAVNELAKVGSLLDVNNPRAPLTLGLSPFGGLGGKAMLKDFRTLMETQ
nr:MAG: RNA-dependent RNA polymerase [Mitovirus sp.]